MENKKKAQKGTKRAIKKIARKNKMMAAQIQYQQHMYEIFKPSPIAAQVALYVASLKNPDKIQRT